QNQLQVLDLSNNIQLQRIEFGNNLLTTLDLSYHFGLYSIESINNLHLEFLNIQNGNNQNISHFFISNNPNLTCIQVDADIVDNIPEGWEYDESIEFSVDCSLGISDLNFNNIVLYP